MTKSRNLRIAFRVTPNEREIISWAAQVMGLGMSEYIRLCALERAGQLLISEQVGKDIDDDRSP